MIDGCLVIDVHNHVSPWLDGMYGRYGQTPDELIARMDRNGIDMAVIFPVVNTTGITPEDFREAHNYILDGVRKYRDRLIGFCFAMPKHGAFALEEIERCTEAGLRGIKLHPHLHGFYPVDSPVLDPIMQKAVELKLPVLTHSDWDSKRATPFQVVRLARRWPTVPIIMAHFGMNSDITHFIPDIAAEVPNVYLDTCATPCMPEHVYVKPVRRLPDRVMFGSDSPSLSPEVELKKVEVAEDLYGLTKEEKRRILGLNAAKVLGIRL